MPTTNDIRQGQGIIFNGQPHTIETYSRVKPGKGATFVHVRLRNVETGQNVDHTWRGEQKVETVFLQTRKHQYLYRQGDTYHFMDSKTYEQVELNAKVLGDDVKYLKENSEVDLVCCDDKPMRMSLPTTVPLKVVETGPGVKGDTASGGSKPATLETGAVIQVPLFLSMGEIIKVDTRTGEYAGRA